MPSSLAVIVARRLPAAGPQAPRRARRGSGRKGLERSKVQALFATLTDQFGPRLAGTPAYKQSAEWARDRMREFGLSDPKLEPWRFGRGWVLDQLVVEMVEPRYMPLIGYAEAWSAPTNGEIVAAPIAVAGTHGGGRRRDEGPARAARSS